MTRKRVLLLITGLMIATTRAVGVAAPPRQSPPIPIQYGQTVEGTLDETHPTVSYVFDASAGDQVSATVNVISGDWLPVLTLTTFSGTLLTVNDNRDGTPSLVISYVIPAAGAYLVNVAASPGGEAIATGTFQLTLVQGILPPVATPTEAPVVEVTPAIVTETPSPPPTITTTVATVGDERLQVIRPGTRVSATLGAGNNFNLYAFEGRAGQEISLTPDAATGFQPLLVLYQSDFTELVRSQPAAVLNATLPQNSIYFIAAATLQPDVGGIYAFTLTERTASGTASTSTAVSNDQLSYGDTATGIVSNTLPLVRYRFRGGAGHAVTITMSAVSGDLDCYLLLVDASGTTIAQNDNASESTTDAELSVTLPEERDYFIIATRRGQEQGLTTGNFVVTLASDAPPPATVSTSSGQLPPEFEGLPRINYGDSVQGNISDLSFINFYVFYGERGDHIEVSMESADSLDTLLILLDAQRIPLAEHDDISNTNKNSLLEFQLPTDGYYAIVATRFDQASGSTEGSYELRLRLTAGPAFDSSQPLLERLAPLRLVAGEVPSGSFDPLRFAALYTFSAAEGSLIDFAVTADGGTVATVILTDSNLNFVTASNNGILLAVAAPRSDDYLVFVAPQAGPAANITGGYIVALNAEGGSRTPVSPEQDIPITYGATVRGTITDDVPEIHYVFQGREGDVVEISMVAAPGAAPLDTFLMLQDATGDTIAENDDIEAGINRNSLLRATLPATGIYTIVATRFSATDDPLTTGDFTLTLQYQDPALAGVNREATLISYGQTLTETITNESYLYFFFFEGRQGDEVAIEVDTIEGTLDPVLYLYALTSAQSYVLLTANDDSPLGNTYDPYIEYTLPRTGGYLLAVTRYTERAAEPTNGTFNITLRLQNPSQ